MGVVWPKLLQRICGTWYLLGPERQGCIYGEHFHVCEALNKISASFVPYTQHDTGMNTLAHHGLRAQHPARGLISQTVSFPPSAWIPKKFKSSTSTSLIYPEPPTTNHRDLASFLDHAERSGLDPKTTLYVGTHYEYTVARTLSKYGFFLRRIGGTSDYGTDLLGTWTVPSSKEPLKVLVQCKALARKSAPNLIRELEGAFVGAPVGWRGQGVLGIFVTEKPATKGVRDSLGRSRWPMGFISCSRAGQVQQILWNQRAEEEGLGGLGVGIRYAGSESEREPQPVLTWKGQHIALAETVGISGEGGKKKKKRTVATRKAKSQS